jgi:Na+/H+ antiporter NhaD/arsenite permease-like protein
MIKAIAEQDGVKMPSFFGYMVYSFVILLPLLIVMTLISYDARKLKLKMLLYM